MRVPGLPQRKLVPLLGEKVLLLIFLAYERMGSMMTFLFFSGKQKGKSESIIYNNKSFLYCSYVPMPTAFFVELSTHTTTHEQLRHGVLIIYALKKES